MTNDVTQLGIAEARKLLDTKEISVIELVSAHEGAIRERDTEVHAYLEVFNDKEQQIASAQKHIEEGTASALTGIPYAVKDNIMYKGRSCTAASRILEGYTSTYDSFVAERLDEQGAILLGRTNMDEFAMGSSTEHSAYGPTKNPCDVSRVPGGTSGGSVAAVSAHTAIFALGSDTAGSVRQPASFCGVVGMKPTYGSVSRRGLMALGSSLDCIGPVTRSVEDAQVVFEAISGHDEMDATSATEEVRRRMTRNTPLKRIGVPRSLVESDGVSDYVRKNFEESLSKLGDAGYEVVDIVIPHIEASLPVYYVVLPAEASTNLARYDGIRFGTKKEGDDLVDSYYKTRGQFGVEVQRRIALGTYVLSAGYYDAYYGKATRVRDLIRDEFNEIFKTIDVIATPTTPNVAFRLGEKSDPVSMYQQDVFTVPANIVGVPSLSIPSGFHAIEGKDLPLGLQFMAPHHNEQYLFEVGMSFEKQNK